MYFNFPCSNCGKNLKVREELAGRRAKCPYCQTAVTIPIPAPPEPAASEPSESSGAADEGAAAGRGGAPATGADWLAPTSGAGPDLYGTVRRPRPGAVPPGLQRPASRAAARKKQAGSDSDDGTNVSMLSTASVGLAATVAFYAVLLPVPPMYFRDLFFDRGWVTVAESFLMFWSIAVLIFKSGKLRRQRRSMLFDMLPDSLGRDITVGNVAAFVNNIQELPVNAGSSFLVQRVLRGLQHFTVRRSAAEVSTVLASQSDLDNNAVSSSYALLNVFIWAIPILGFIGTVQGLGQAVGNLSGSLQGATDINSVKGALGGITAGLGVAFDTTLVALIMALFLKFPASSLQKAEEDLLNWVDEYCNENLLKRLQETSGGEAAPDAPTRAIYKAIDAALVPHHAELRAWEARLREIGKSLTDELTRGWAGIQQDLQGQHAERVTQLQALLTTLADTSQLQSAAIGQLQELQHVQVEHGTAAVQAMSDQVAAIQRQAEEHRARLETTGTQFLEQARQAVVAVAEQGQAAHQQLAQSVQESAAETALAATALGDHFGLLRQAVQNLNEVLGQLDGKQVVIQTTGRPGRWWNPFGRGR